MTDLIPIRRELLERLYEAAGRGTGMENEDLRSVRTALAAPVQGEAEPVAFAAQNTTSGKFGYIWHEESDVRGWINLQHQSDCGTWRGPIPLYTTPPQPAEVVELVELLREVREYGTGRPAPKGQQILERIDAALAKLEGKE